MQIHCSNESDITNYHFTLSISEILNLLPFAKEEECWALASPHLLFCIKVSVSDRLRQQQKHHHVCHQVVIELMGTSASFPLP
jgi:hypothetical protein